MAAYLKTEIATAEVDNPYFTTDHPEALGNMRRVLVTVNLRERSRLLSKRLNLEPHQIKAKDHFQDAWNIMAGCRSTALGERTSYRRQRSLSEAILDAGQDLRSCRNLLGHRSYGLICAVCGEGRELPELFHVKRERLTAADNVRAGLDDMAGMWGYMQLLRVDRR